MAKFCSLLWAGLLAASLVVADPTPIDDATMQHLLNNNTVNLAMANMPVWFFGKFDGAKPAIPTWAYGADVRNQNYNADSRTAPAERCYHFFDNGYLACNAIAPDRDVGNPTQRFPVYYSVKQCNPNEVRVSFSLFYQKDGYFLYGYGDSGHDWDWERVVIKYQQDSSGNWSALNIGGSFHAGYTMHFWDEIQNTLNYADATGPDPRTPQGVQNEDHPKVYVSSVKHAIFFEKNTGWTDFLSAYTSLAYRSDDWWYFPQQSDMIEVTKDGPIDKALRSNEWGEANTTPSVVLDDMCSVGFPPPRSKRKLKFKKRVTAEALAENIKSDDYDIEMTPDQWAIYTNDSTYSTDNGNFSLSTVTSNLTKGMSPVALAELQAMGLPKELVGAEGEDLFESDGSFNVTLYANASSNWPALSNNSAPSFSSNSTSTLTTSYVPAAATELGTFQINAAQAAVAKCGQVATSSSQCPSECPFDSGSKTCAFQTS